MIYERRLSKFVIVNYLRASPRGIERKFIFDFNASVGAFKSRLSSKISPKGDNLSLSFYAFFKNKNDNLILLMEETKWWIIAHKLDHFEKAVKMKQIVKFK